MLVVVDCVKLFKMGIFKLHFYFKEQLKCNLTIVKEENIHQEALIMI